VQFLLDFIPILVFFIVYKAKGIYAATAVGMGLSLLPVIWKRVQLKRFEPMSLGIFIAIAVLGSATLFFQNSLFIKWKPTVIYWAMGLAFFITPWMYRETLVQKMFHPIVKLKPSHWFRLNCTWVVFLTTMGGLNLYVAYNHNTNTWVNFKLFGTLGLTLLFLMMQGFLMAKYNMATTGTAIDEHISPSTESTKPPTH